jgi:cephalosporin-C deacetylase-like acetyl esterase
MKIAILIAATIAALLALPSCQAQQTPYQQYLPLYADDPAAPLGVRQEGTGKFQGGRWGKITYAGKGAEKVPALIYLPDTASAKHPAPCLILLHGLGGNKEMMTPLAQFLAGAGYASFMIDEAGQGERNSAGANVFPTFTSEQDMTKSLVDDGVATVVDLRRGIDYLQSRPDIAKDKIGLIGFSLGALEGAILGGVDDRVKAVALVSGGGNLGEIIADQAKNNQSLGGHYAALLAGTTADQLEDQLAPVDPLNFVGHIAPRPLLMEHGRNDVIIPPANAQALYDDAGQPKQIVWFADAGHMPPPLELYPALSLFLSKYLPA